MNLAVILYSRFKRDMVIWVINPYKCKKEPEYLTPKIYRELPEIFQAKVDGITKSAKYDKYGKQIITERLDLVVDNKCVYGIDANYVYRTKEHALEIHKAMKCQSSQNDVRNKCTKIQHEELNENRSLDTTFVTQEYDLGDEMNGEQVIEIVCNCFMTFYITLKDGRKLLHRRQSSERRN